MPPVVSFVGKSESGKTTLIEKLIPLLKARGLRVGIVKHAHHGFDMDREGKDSYRYRQAGADTTVIASPGRIAMIKDHPAEGIADILSLFPDVDILITEGFKKERAPKIEVFRAERHQAPACIGDETLVAVVSDFPLAVTVPRFSPSDIPAIADFIVNRFLPDR